MPVPAHVLVSCHASAQGDAALREAALRARDAGAHLTVVAVAVRERPHGGCCGIQTDEWNRCLEELAREDLMRAERVLGRRAGADLVMATGASVAAAVAREAQERGADVIVVPGGRGVLGLPRLFGLPRAVRRRAACAVVEAPASR